MDFEEKCHHDGVTICRKKIMVTATAEFYDEIMELIINYGCFRNNKKNCIRFVRYRRPSELWGSKGTTTINLKNRNTLG
jgi:hypothetical protein